MSNSKFYRIPDCIHKRFWKCTIAFSIILLLAVPKNGLTQNCGTNDEPPQRSYNFSNLKFYQDEDCKPITIKCNYIILTRDDGTGGMDDSFLNSIKISPNLWWGKVADVNNCPDGLGAQHPKDAKINLGINVFYEANTEAWDYYEAAQNYDNDPNTGSYYQDLFVPRRVANDESNPNNSPNINNDPWPALNNVAQNYRAMYPDRINILFVENGPQFEFYEAAIENNLDTPGPWSQFDPNPNYSEIFDGASFFPSSDYYNNRNREFIIMANSYTHYLGLLNFGHIEQPSSSKSNEELASNYKWRESGTIDHELGHSFHLSHTCVCPKDLMQDWIVYLLEMLILLV